MPQGGLREDLERLTALVNETGAQRMIMLGDVLHSRRGISDVLAETIGAWRRECSLEILWIEGNHDRGARGVPEAWRMQRIEGVWEEEGFCFAHEPAPTRSDLYMLCGHLHPVVQLRSRLDRMRLPAFWFEERIGILPSFGSFTGGAEVSPSKKGRVMAIANEMVWDLTRDSLGFVGSSKKPIPMSYV